MKKSSFHILRVGLGTTFLWIGILILKDPQGWGGFVLPWAYSLLPFSLEKTMLGIAVFDIIAGLMMIVGYRTGWAAFLGALHLAVVLTVSGINTVTVRNIGLLAAALAVWTSSLPPDFLKFLRR